MTEYPHIIFYDGLCGLCNKAVQIIIKHDKKKVFRFAALESDMAKTKLKSMDDIDSIVLLSNGQTYIFSDAILKICAMLGYPLKLAVIFHIIPKIIRDKVYKFVARHRYKIWGKHDSCPIPTEKQRKLFIDSR